MRQITTGRAPAPAGHYAQAVVHDGMLYMAAQLPIDPVDPGRVTPDAPFSVQLEQLLETCRVILAEAGASPADVLSFTFYITDVENWDEIDRQFAAFCGAHLPARGVIVVPAIRKGYAVLASLVATVPDLPPSPVLYHVDAFTKQPFRGNSAGVVLNADSLSAETMQRIARELRHSETAFVLAPDGDDHDVRIRYFSPTVEVPICGHATIAAHYARAYALGLEGGTLVQKTGAGLQKIALERSADGDLRVVMHQGPISFEEPFADELCAEIAAALGLRSEDLAPHLPVQVVSTGHSKVMVPLAAHVDLDALAPDMAALSAISARTGCNGFFPFQIRPGGVRATDGRMFAPAIGIAEDPVTGNANGPLGAYLVRHQAMPHDSGVLEFEGHQGRALGRDGIVHVRVEISHGAPVHVSIAGDAVILFRADSFAPG